MPLSQIAGQVPGLVSKVTGFLNGLGGKVTLVVLALSLAGGWYHSQIAAARAHQAYVDSIATQQAQITADSTASAHRDSVLADSIARITARSAHLAVVVAVEHARSDSLATTLRTQLPDTLKPALDSLEAHHTAEVAGLHAELADAYGLAAIYLSQRDSARDERDRARADLRKALTRSIALDAQAHPGLLSRLWNDAPAFVVTAVVAYAAGTQHHK